MSHDYDLIVLGAGSGGVRAARVAAGHGARVAIVEEYRVGGTCVIRGCVPKKLLVYGSHFAEDLADAEHFGWSIEGRRFDWARLRDGVAGEVTRLEGLYGEMLGARGVKVIHGRGRIVGAHAVAIGDRRATARHILIATGATPRRLDVPGADMAITSNEAFGLDALPVRVAIVGAGYIANEFAGVFRALGSAVTLVNRSATILRSYDAQIRDRLMQISAAKGIVYRLDTRIKAIERHADGLHIRFAEGDPLTVDQVLVATGRVPNSAGLGLEDVGVALAADGRIPIDDRYATAVPTIHAIGDVTDRVQLTPVAIREGQALADRIFGGIDTWVDYDCIPSAVFSHPPLAGVGLTEEQARETLGQVRIYTSDFRPMKNVLAARDERALYKLVVDDATDRVVGAHLIGPDAPEIAQAVAIAVKAGLTKAQFDQVVAIHPTMAEELVLMR